MLDIKFLTPPTSPSLISLNGFCGRKATCFLHTPSGINLHRTLPAVTSYHTLSTGLISAIPCRVLILTGIPTLRKLICVTHRRVLVCTIPGTGVDLSRTLPGTNYVSHIVGVLTLRHTSLNIICVNQLYIIS